jgi:hypothetical protein
MTLDAAIDPAAPEVHLPPQSIMAVATNNGRSGAIGPQRSRRRCLRSFAVARLYAAWPRAARIVARAAAAAAA